MAFILPELLASTADVTLPNLLEAQERLEAEARQVLPYSFDECTFPKGAIRQSVWSCMDCGEKGVCYGCSISCHSEHRLVELWAKRSFTCDCPTSAMCSPSSSTGTGKRKCHLFPTEQQPQPPNESNTGRYTHNFRGEFCRCGRDYDPETESEAMIHCIGCEDWFHESCLNLAPRKPERIEPLDEDEEESDSLLPSDSYDGLLCAACAAHPFVNARRGKEGWMVIVPQGEGWVVEGQKPGDVNEEGKTEGLKAGGEIEPDVVVKPGVEITPTGQKRASEDDQPAVKRARVDDTSQALAAIVTAEPASASSTTAAASTEPVAGTAQSAPPTRTSAGDIFLAHGIREHLKATLSDAEAAALPFPLVDEVIYEPPADSPPETLEEVTQRVVGGLPRAQAIEALYGYEVMRDKLKVMLAGHVASGEAVSRDDIESFFENLRASRAK
ncbi:hypothetical protein CspeluHIS016_0602300 [Cutaneotrichosporon spelunceum]|uniref:UBR-type domain-containing protein n=1 Tax=Cutaneotrichosporon spelunceum TaxID=1672016 RepID=A0AAD3TXX4_9TREE|nr:hypothetical protein CspeluHIS016_0602300 [Cutaneotrichosporon spelunceum]